MAKSGENDQRKTVSGCTNTVLAIASCDFDLGPHNSVDRGRKLNVHRTFSLRPVSTGKGDRSTPLNPS